VRWLRTGLELLKCTGFHRKQRNGPELRPTDLKPAKSANVERSQHLRLARACLRGAVFGQAAWPVFRAERLVARDGFLFKETLVPRQNLHGFWKARNSNLRVLEPKGSKNSVEGRRNRARRDVEI